MNDSRIVVVGASGYIGRHLVAAGLGDNARMVGLSSRFGGDGLPPIDLTDAAAFDYSAINPQDKIIFCAAISSPEFCAREAAYAEAVNVVGTSTFIERAIDRGAQVIFLSSDTVYGEAQHVVAEDGPCNPAGIYGQMKFTLEQRFANNEAVKVARLSYVISRHDKFSEYLAGCVQKGSCAEIFHPFNRCAVYLGDVIEGLLTLAQNWSRVVHPVINFAGPALVSRLEIAEALRRHVLPELKLKVVNPEDNFFKDRPRTINISSLKMEDLLGRKPLSIDRMMMDDLKTFYDNLCRTK